MAVTVDNNDRMAVLFIVSTLARMGPVRQLYNLVKYLDCDHFAPTILTLSPEPRDTLLARFRDLGVPVSSLGLSRIGSALVGIRKLKRFIRRHPINVLHSCGGRADLLCALSGLRIPWIATRRATLLEYNPMRYGRVVGRAMDMVELLVLRRAQRAVFLRDDARENAQRRRANSVLIRNGADGEVFVPPVEGARREARRRLGLPEGNRIYISVGHLDPLKDPLTVIRGFRASASANGQILILLGDGRLRKQCEALGGKDRSIRILGHVRNTLEYYQASDVFVSASLTEGCPNALLEALACGLPVVLSDIPAHREILKLAPKAGALFPVKDERALGACLRDIVNDDYSSRSEAALSIVRNHLNARNMSAQYQEVYLECHREHSGLGRNQGTQEKSTATDRRVVQSS